MRSPAPEAPVIHRSMLPLALSAMERAQKIPKEIWINVAIGIGILIAVVFLFRKLAGANKIWLSIIITVVVVIVGFQWVYERNEPKFMTPFIEKVAPFFPSKIDYNKTQQKGPKM